MNIADNYQSMTSFMMGLKLDSLESLLKKSSIRKQKPKFRINWTNGGFYLSPLNFSAGEMFGKI